MAERERKAQEISKLLENQSSRQLAAKVLRKTGAKVNKATIIRAGNNENISDNMLHLIHYVLTH